jgi:outer membrane protein
LPFATPAQVTDYQNRSAQLTLNQPVWRHTYVIAVEESRRASEQSQFEVLAAGQDMMVRLIQAWLDLMLAADDISAADSKVEASRLFWDQARRAGAIELAGPEKLEDARAKYETAVAERMAALTEEDVARATLEEILGVVEPFVSPSLSDVYTVPLPDERERSEWLERAGTGPLVEAAHQARLAADEEIRKQRAGGGLTLDIVGTLGRTYQQQGNFPGQEGYDVKQRSIGLQLSLPIYSGGAVGAKVKEAVALRSKANQDLLTASRKARSTVQAAWSGWRSGCARVIAARQSLHAATVALRVAEGGSNQGLKFGLDVLEARQNLYEAWRDLQKARYEAVMSRVKVKATAGELSEEDLLELHHNMVSRNTRIPDMAWPDAGREPQ